MPNNPMHEQINRPRLSSFLEISRAATPVLIAFISLFLPLLHANAQTQSNQSSPLGTNLIEVTYFTAEQPFLNIIKTGSMWAGNTTAGTRFDETQNVFQLDVNGYPTSMSGIGPAAGQTFTEIDTLVLRDISFPAGNYVLLYEGTGTFAFQFDANNSNIISSTPGRIVINVPAPTGAGIKIILTSTGAASNYAKNFRLVYSPDSTGSTVGARETLLNSGEIFNPDFISQVAPFKTIRFMKWMNTVNSYEFNLGKSTDAIICVLE